ncbi:hypothetical protein ACFY0A_37735 [Streptomyces sp. NPDC001698]|uniref:hypothetical protein n=1 Tax=Streptomyces sp. NPDC001698 TaxID=3364601 RepID=UPI0036B630D8
MATYADVIELLNVEGPGLQDFVTPAELDQLLDGTLAHGVIADRYMKELADNASVAVETSEAETRADLLSWIRWELEVAVEQHHDAATEQAQQNKLDAIRKVAAVEKRFASLAHFRKGELVLEACQMRIPKAAIADALDVSRPTLDKWITDQNDRALFNQALYLLGRNEPAARQRMLFDALGIRDTSGQASVLLAALQVGPTEEFTAEQQAIIDRAEKRARELA